MLKKITIWGVVAVAAVLALQVLLREGPPKSLFVPPRMELPGLDRAPEREPLQPAEREPLQPAERELERDGR